MTMKGSGQRVGAAVDRDLALVHGLQQRRLGLGRGAVDFVGQQEMGEDGPLLEFERLRLGVVDGDADDVAGEHVAGELQAVEGALDRARQGLREGGLAHAGNVFDQQVALGEQADQREPDDLRLPSNDLTEARFQLAELRSRDRRGLGSVPLGHQLL